MGLTEIWQSISDSNQPSWTYLLHLSRLPLWKTVPCGRWASSTRWRQWANREELLCWKYGTKIAWQFITVSTAWIWYERGLAWCMVIVLLLVGNNGHEPFSHFDFCGNCSKTQMAHRRSGQAICAKNCFYLARPRSMSP